MCWWSAATARRVGELGLEIVLSTGIGRDELRTLTGQAAQLVEVLLASMTSPAARRITSPGEPVRHKAGGWHIDCSVRSNDQAVRKHGRAERECALRPWRGAITRRDATRLQVSQRRIFAHLDRPRGVSCGTQNAQFLMASVRAPLPFLQRSPAPHPGVG